MDFLFDDQCLPFGQTVLPAKGAAMTKRCLLERA